MFVDVSFGGKGKIIWVSEEEMQGGTLIKQQFLLVQEAVRRREERNKGEGENAIRVVSSKEKY